jgi:Tol biopolymer transport system component
MFSNGAGKKLVSSSGGMPSFNPAGNMIAFDNNGIWTSSVTVAGTTITVGVPKQIVAVGVGLGSAWSQNGSQIAYIRMLNNTEKLMVVNVSDGSPVDSLSMSGGFLDVVWQPSSKILFSHSGDLYSYDPTAGTSTTNPSRLTTSGSGNFYPSWSPAADQISWTNGKTGISIMSALGGTGKLVIPGGTQGSWAQ